MSASGRKSPLGGHGWISSPERPESATIGQSANWGGTTAPYEKRSSTDPLAVFRHQSKATVPKKYASHKDCPDQAIAVSPSGARSSRGGRDCGADADAVQKTNTIERSLTSSTVGSTYLVSAGRDRARSGPREMTLGKLTLACTIRPRQAAAHHPAGKIRAR